ncbi:MAG TPA: glycosyltransferase family 4 protein [Candidatus Dormibacteraeota bacterium]|nr:glycosyltransferase family 4 protein [Candidatus Dormibacteraeota bacterium]
MTLDPRSTVFVLLSFEGPDVYSQAGGLGVRVKGLSRTLARLGYPTYLYFCGDPDLPGEEAREDGRLQLRRWCQWISAQHRGGVYDGEEGKIRDWNYSLPSSLIDTVIAPAIADGKLVVVLGEEWHTSWSMKLISDLLLYRGLRDRVVMLWNANNTFGFNRIDWNGLSFATTITTVSRYMKFRMWEWGQNPIVIPNGIPRESIVDSDPAAMTKLRSAACTDNLWFKIGRFDPDKRWLMAVSAAALMKRRDRSVKLLIRGGREPHGLEVLARAQSQGLRIKDAPGPADIAGVSAVLRDADGADVINLTSFIGDSALIALYSASDAVLANSGQEPFGLVGLEVMGAGGVAVTGSTGEDYAEPFRNAVVLDTDDPVEIVSELSMLKEQPRMVAALRRRGKATARDYVWDKVIGQLLLRVEFAAQRQEVKLPVQEAGPSKRRVPQTLRSLTKQQ